MRRLPGPAHYRPGDGGNSRGSLRIVSGLAVNTNSIFCDGSQRPEAANGCPVLQGTTPPRGTRAQRYPDRTNSAPSTERAGKLVLFSRQPTYMDAGNPPTIGARRRAYQQVDLKSRDPSPAQSKAVGMRLGA